MMSNLDQEARVVLTETERVVISMLLEGRMPSEMATTLGWSERRLGAEFEGLYSKLEVGDPLELVLFVLEKGLVDRICSQAEVSLQKRPASSEGPEVRRRVEGGG
jgi:DNA-binding NarL/FixJ family response regulator